MRDEAATRGDVGGDAFASEALGAARAVRLRSLADDGRTPPFFGRTDRVRDTDDRGTGLEEFHIGRRHIRDDDGEPVVIDWRAPLARPFYQATTVAPRGVALRRRFGFALGRLTSYEDEQLIADHDAGRADEALGRLVVEEIERPRAGPMRDIVATIAPEQDDIVRAPLEQSLCIQGSPGTGKTAVGLHRAAYLLYTYPDRLHRTGVLVVGPNAAFLRYIAAVLPALGEVDVSQSTVDELTSRAPVRGNDSERLAALKGDLRWARTLRRAVYGRIGKPVDSLQLPLAGRKYRITEAQLRRYVDDTRRSGVPYAVGRERLAMMLAEDARRQKEVGGGAPTDPETRRAARSAEVQDWLELVWPTVDPVQLLAALLGDPQVLSRAGGPDWSLEEIAELTTKSLPANAGRVRWTAADAVLLDEIEGLLNRSETYGHVILDEAQDLSAMQLRAVARRAAAGSVTVLGDVAQGTSPWSIKDWAAAMATLGKPDAVIQVLTRGYRVPGEILTLANRLLPDLAPDLPPATSVRPGRGSVSVHDVDDLLADLPDLVEVVLAQPGSVGVITADDQTVDVLSALADRGLPAVLLGSAGDDDEESRLVVVAASLAKGLEYDHVVLVEPAALVAAEARGLHRLYIALTRAVTSLTIVHRDRLPAELGRTAA